MIQVVAVNEVLSDKLVFTKKNSSRNHSILLFIYVAQDGRIRKGDRIIAINDEPFTDVTYEQARSILLRLKLQ